MKTSRLYVGLLLVLFSSTSAQAAEAQTAGGSQSASMGSPDPVMQRWVGSWMGGVAGGSSSILPHIMHFQGGSTADWTLDRNFVMGTNTDDSGKPLTIWMMKHDAATHTYPLWYFSANGVVSTWTGVWNAADQTMSWKGASTESGASGTARTHFVDKDHQEWSVEIKDKDGKMTTDNGTLTRK